MKTDKFSEAIRRKLAQLQPSFKEQDWGKMKSFMDGQSPPSFWQQYGNGLLYVASGVIITTLLITNYFQNIENKTLRSTVQTLNQKVTELQKPEAQNEDVTVKSNETITLNTDSNNNLGSQNIDKKDFKNIDSEKTEQIENNNFEKPIKNKPSQTEKITVIDEAENLNNDEFQSGNSENTLTSKTSKNKFKNIISSKSENQIALNQRKFGRKTARSNKSYQDNFTNRLNNETEKQFISSIDGELNTGISELPLRGAGGLLLSPLQPIDTVYLISDLPTKKIRVKAPFLAKEILTTKKSFSLPFLLQAGLSYNLNVVKHETGIGIWTELFISKKLSLGVGLDYMSLDEPRFNTDDNFTNKRRENFRDLYAPKIPMNQDIFNIDVSEKRIQLPILLTYHFPLKNNFSILTSIGTSLNLNAKQNIAFNVRRGPSDYIDGKFRSEVRKPIFTNIVLGVGIEKTWNKFVIQALPTFNFQTISSPKNKPDDDNRISNIGLRIRALYRF